MKNLAYGFHDNLPLCETHRVGKACTVCRLRLAAGFSYAERLICGAGGAGGTRQVRDLSDLRDSF